MKRSALAHAPLQIKTSGSLSRAHVRDVDGQTFIKDGCTPVDIDGGFEIAPGDASDVEVSNAHAWGSGCLVFSDGAGAASALFIAQDPSEKGIASYFCK